MRLKIESTETGIVLNIRKEASIDKLKFQISLLVSIPPQDQILLIGPPYRILDGVYNMNMPVEGKRIFVFNRKMLVEGIEPQKVKLLPYEVPKPELLGDSPRSFSMNQDVSSSFLVSMLSYEALFRKILKRFQSFETFISESLSSCSSCVNQHQIQLDGIQAAISNLQDTYAGIKRPYESYEKLLSKQQSTHLYLLETFETNLNKLADVQLHPRLVEAIQSYQVGRQSTLNQSTAGINIVSPSTLYDCIPVEREKVYLQQCTDTYQKVEDNLTRIRFLFSDISSSVMSLQPPVIDFDHINEALETIARCNAAQSEVMVEVRTIYQYVYDIINNESSPTPPKLTEQADLAQSIQSENSSNSTGTISASSVNLNTRDKQTVREDYSESFGSASSVGIKGVQLTMSGGIKVVDQSSILESLESKKQYLENQQISALMEARVREVKAAKIEIEKSKNLLVRAIYMIMRHIALLQTDIQYKLRRDIEWMKKFSSSHNDSFKHLEHIGRLPAIYQQLLNEIVRRRNYNEIFEAEVQIATKKISSFRKEETSLRENFMRNYGLHLPPIFFKVIPHLKDKPPYFNPVITDAQWLPDIQYSDIKHDMLMESNFKSVLNDDMVEETGSGKSMKSESETNVAFSSKSTNEKMDGGRKIGFDNDREVLSDADRSSSVILPAVAEDDTQAAREEMAYLAYENTKLMRMVADLEKKLEIATDRSVVSASSMMIDSTISMQEINSSNDVRYRTRSNSVESLQSATTRNDKNNNEDWKVTDRNVNNVHTDVNIIGKEQKPISQLESSAEPSLLPNVTEKLERSEKLLTFYQNKVSIISQMLNNLQSQTDLDFTSPSLLEVLQSETAVGDLAAISKHRDLAQQERNIDQLIRAENKGTIVSENDPSAVSQSVENVMVVLSKCKIALDAISKKQQDQSAVQEALVQSGTMSETVKADETSVDETSSTAVRLPMISFMEFKAGDIALFIPHLNENRKNWIAFHANCPHHYLAEESVNQFIAKSKNKDQRGFIMGKLFLTDSAIASEKNNPYKIPLGTVFHVCFAEPVFRGSHLIQKRATAQSPTKTEETTTEDRK